MGRALHILLLGGRGANLAIPAELREAGYEVISRHVATKGELTAALKETKWQMVWVGQMPPQWTVLEAIKLVRKQALQLPVIALGEAMNTGEALKALRAGANDYVLTGEGTRMLLAVERALQAAQATPHANGFFENASIGLRWVGADGYILRANPADLKMLGYRAEEYVEHHISEFHAVQGEGEQILARLARKENVCNFETLLRCKDGSIKHVLIDANVVWSDGHFRQALFFDRDITDRKRAMKEILEAREREQQRLGQDLHDGLCQHLIGIRYKTALLAKLLREKSAGEVKHANDILELLNQAVHETHRLARGLQPVKLDAEGLMFALRELASNTAALYNVKCVFRYRKSVLVRDNVTAIHLYRIAQEAVSNAVKHGKATGLVITLIAQRGRLFLAIKDNGIGFCPANNGRTGMGLHIMEYRARTINASLSIRGRPNGGTRVLCTLAANGAKQDQES